MITQNTLLSELGENELKVIQQHLQRLGYYDDLIDGFFGKNTSQGWAEFKSDRWLGETNLIGKASYDLLLNDVVKLPPVIDWTNFNSKISEYFTVGEVCQGITNDGRYVQYRERLPVDNFVKNNAIRLAKLMDKVREDWGSPLLVTSWNRPYAVNSRIKGSSTRSQHLTGSAVDIRPANGKAIEFENWVNPRWKMAMGLGARAKGFTHFDLRPNPNLRWYY